MNGAIEVRAAVEVGWPGVADVLAGPGDAATCWCQWFRLTSRELDEAGPSRLQGRLRAEVEGPAPGPGVVALRDGEPIGWCGLGPRDGYPRFERSPLLRGVEPAPWIVTCFVVAPEHRRQGVAAALLAGAVAHARAHGAAGLHAVPVDTAMRSATTAGELYHGPLQLFLRAGFIEVARPSPARPVVRLDLDDQPRASS